MENYCVTCSDCNDFYAIGNTHECTLDKNNLYVITKYINKVDIDYIFKLGILFLVISIILILIFVGTDVYMKYFSKKMSYVELL
jgi:hypothetical protein